MFNFATDFYIFTVTYQKQKTKIYIKKCTLLSPLLKQHH